MQHLFEDEFGVSCNNSNRIAGIASSLLIRKNIHSIPKKLPKKTTSARPLEGHTLQQKKSGLMHGYDDDVCCQEPNIIDFLKFIGEMPHLFTSKDVMSRDLMSVSGKWSRNISQEREQVQDNNDEEEYYQFLESFDMIGCLNTDCARLEIDAIEMISCPQRKNGVVALEEDNDGIDEEWGNLDMIAADLSEVIEAASISSRVTMAKHQTVEEMPYDEKVIFMEDWSRLDDGLEAKLPQHEKQHTSQLDNYLDENDVGGDEEESPVFSESELNDVGKTRSKILSFSCVLRDWSFKLSFF